jgi:hypothetical protein
MLENGVRPLLRYTVLRHPSIYMRPLHKSRKRCKASFALYGIEAQMMLENVLSRYTVLKFPSIDQPRRYFSGINVLSLYHNIEVLQALISHTLSLHKTQVKRSAQLCDPVSIDQLFGCLRKNAQAL